MIKQFNRQQLLLGLLQCAAGLVLLLLFWVLMLYLVSILMVYMPWTWNKSFTAKQVASYVVAVFVFFAVRAWFRQGEQFHIFRDAPFRAALEENPESTHMHEGEEYVSDAMDIIRQAIYSGPRLLCTGIARMRSMLPKDADLEERMVDVLQRLRARKGWVPVEQCRDHVEAMGALIRCGLVDFSVTKRRLRAVPEPGAGPSDEPPDEPPKFDPNDEPIRWDGPK